MGPRVTPRPGETWEWTFEGGKLTVLVLRRRPERDNVWQHPRGGGLAVAVDVVPLRTILSFVEGTEDSVRIDPEDPCWVRLA